MDNGVCDKKYPCAEKRSILIPREQKMFTDFLFTNNILPQE